MWLSPSSVGFPSLEPDSCPFAPSSPVPRAKSAPEVMLSPASDSGGALVKGRCITPDSAAQPPAKRRRYRHSGRFLEKGLSLENIIPTPTRRLGSLKKLLRKRRASPHIKARYLTRTAVNGERQVNYNVDKRYDMLLGRYRANRGLKRAHSFSSDDASDGGESSSSLSEVEQMGMDSSPLARPIPHTWAELSAFDRRIYLLQKGIPTSGQAYPKTWPKVIEILLKEKLLTQSQLNYAGGNSAVSQRYETMCRNLRGTMDVIQDLKSKDSVLGSPEEFDLFYLKGPKKYWESKNQKSSKHRGKGNSNGHKDESGVDADEELSIFCEGVFDEDMSESSDNLACSEVNHSLFDGLFTEDNGAVKKTMKHNRTPPKKPRLSVKVPSFREEALLGESDYGLQTNSDLASNIAKRIPNVQPPKLEKDNSFSQRPLGVPLFTKSLPPPEDEDLHSIERDNDGTEDAAFLSSNEAGNDGFVLPTPGPSKAKNSKRSQKKKKVDFKIYEDPEEQVRYMYTGLSSYEMMMDLPKENFAEDLDIEDTDVIRELMDGLNPRFSIEQRRARRQGIANAPGSNRRTLAPQAEHRSPEPDLADYFRASRRDRASTSVFMFRDPEFVEFNL